MIDHPPPIDWDNPIPGNASAIQGEIDRVRDLRDRCRASADSIRRIDLVNWHGPAAEQFHAFTGRLARPWRDAEDEHERWANGLVEYWNVLTTTQQLARSVITQAAEDGNWTRAAADINRLREQYNLAAHKAADVLDDVAESLRSLPKPFGEAGTGPALPFAAQRGTAGPVARAKVSRATDGQSEDVEPDAVNQSPAALYQQVTSLSNALLDAEFVSAESVPRSQPRLPGPGGSAG